jgi:hypothetical protein
MKEGMAKVRTIGLALLEVKARLGHGPLGRWIDENLPFSQQWARKCMRLAKRNHGFVLEDELQVFAASDEEEETKSGEWQKCRDHRYLEKPQIDCKRCRKLNPGHPLLPPKPIPDEHARLRSLRTNKIKNKLRCKIFDQNLQDLLWSRMNGMLNGYKMACDAPDKPIPPPRYRQTCKRCHATITWATTDKHKNVPLGEAKDGPWDVVAGVACYVKEGGLYRLHFRCMKPKQTVSDEPIPE